MLLDRAHHLAPTLPSVASKSTWRGAWNTSDLFWTVGGVSGATLRAGRVCRTISGEAVCMLAGVMPWDLDALSLESIYYRRRGLASREPVSQARGGAGSRIRNVEISAGITICRSEYNRSCSFSLPPVVSTASRRPSLPHHTRAHGAWLLWRLPVLDSWEGGRRPLPLLRRLPRWDGPMTSRSWPVAVEEEYREVFPSPSPTKPARVPTRAGIRNRISSWLKKKDYKKYLEYFL